MSDIILGLKPADCKRHLSQYNCRMGMMLRDTNLLDGNELAGIVAGVQRNIGDGSPYYHAMRLLHPGCGGAFYQVTKDEFILLLLPFSNVILCYSDTKDLDDKISKFCTNKGTL